MSHTHLPICIGIGYELGSFIPNAFPCFNKQIKRGIAPILSQCKKPGLEIDFLHTLLHNFHLRNNCNFTILEDRQSIAKQLNEGKLDLSGKVDRQYELDPTSNITLSNVIWTKDYCFAFIEPSNMQFLATFSPVSPFNIGTWSALMASMLLSIIVSAYLYNFGDFSAWKQFEYLFLQSEPRSNFRWQGYLLVAQPVICILGLIKIIYCTQVASHLVVKPLPPELATMEEFEYFVKHSRYHLYSKYDMKRINGKYFRHAKLQDALHFFKKRGIQRYKSNDYGQRYLARKWTTEFVTTPEQFIMPLSVQKARQARSVANHIKIICLIDNVQFTEIIMLRKGKIAEKVNRFILRLLTSGIKDMLLAKYLGPKLVDFHGSDQSIEMLEFSEVNKKRTMRYIAGYCLAVMGGNESPTADDIYKIISSVGVEFDIDRANQVVDAFKGKQLEHLISQGMSQLATLPLKTAATIDVNDDDSVQDNSGEAGPICVDSGSGDECDFINLFD